MGEIKELVNEPSHPGVDHQLGMAVQRVILLQMPEGSGYLTFGEVLPRKFFLSACHPPHDLRRVSKIDEEYHPLVDQILGDPFHELRICDEIYHPLFEFINALEEELLLLFTSTFVEVVCIFVLPVVVRTGCLS